jgi:hypothetical protein
VALGADEVVVVPVAAEAVAERVTEVSERFDHAGVDEGVERSIDSREADGVATSPQAVVELLGGSVVALAVELNEEPKPLARGAEAVRAQ